MEVAPLSQADIAARIASLATLPDEDGIVLPMALDEVSGAHDFQRGQARNYRHYEPLASAADEFIEWARTKDSRVYLGLPEFDEAMRGLAPGELALVVGFAHGGKTQLTLEVLRHNRDRRIAYFSPDETRSAVLVKLACMMHDVSAEDLENRIFRGDQSAVKLLRETAHAYPHLAVYDRGLSLFEMSRALDEAEDAWGGRCELAVFDYLELLPSDEGGDSMVKSQANALKAWGKARNVPLIVLHQASRTKGADGQEMTMTSGGYGGEQQAIFLIGVRRKREELRARIKELRAKLANPSSNHRDVLEDALHEAEDDLRRHANTITFSLLKNKRPPCHLVEESDYTLDMNSGRLTPFVMRQAGLGTSTTDALRRRVAMQRNFYGEEEPF